MCDGYCEGPPCRDYDSCTERAPLGTRPATCSVCAAVRKELENVVQNLGNAPHAAFDRSNVEALARSLLVKMDEAQNASGELPTGAERKQNDIRQTTVTVCG